jgi:hypothetical protein
MLPIPLTSLLFYCTQNIYFLLDFTQYFLIFHIVQDISILLQHDISKPSEYFKCTHTYTVIISLISESRDLILRIPKSPIWLLKDASQILWNPFHTAGCSVTISGAPSQKNHVLYCQNLLNSYRLFTLKLIYAVHTRVWHTLMKKHNTTYRDSKYCPIKVNVMWKAC